MPDSVDQPVAAESPCVQICSIDPDTQRCRGCLRSLSEIAQWMWLSPAERRAIMADLPARRTRPTPSP